jgi:SAM-dependent methyltransferase
VGAQKDVHAWLRSYWDTDAATYDLAPEHVAQTAAQRAAWTAAVKRLLPPPPARVLDVGAGTGFLSLTLARLGHDVTALDISREMLARLRAAAEAESLEVEAVEGSAEEPPQGPFDAVVERLVLWTLPDPWEALRRWREVVPQGRLVSFGGVWASRDRLTALRGRIRSYVRRARGNPPEHHAPYDAAVLRSLPLGYGPSPSALVDAVEAAGWRGVRLERLWDVEWAQSLALSPAERLLGVVPEFAIVADAGAPSRDAGATDAA